MKQFKVPYAYLGKTPEAGTAEINAPSSEDAARILALLRPNAIIGVPREEQHRRKQMTTMNETISEIIHEALVKVKEFRGFETPGTFSHTLSTQTMKELADLEFRIFNQEMDAST